nr:PIG-L family deacetylase [Candidatus Sigynarchaeota archaeon]
MATHVFLSPHLDDAVESCGGLMAKLRHNGEQVLVITCFQKQQNLDEIPRKMKVFADYKQRYEENGKALQMLDVKHRGLDFFERAFVQPYLTSLPAVFFAPPGGSSKYLDFHRLTESIKQIVNEDAGNNNFFYAPLGIGNHYDHTRLFFAAVKVMEETGRHSSFLFYEDAYSLMGNAIRKKHPIARECLYPKSADPSRLSPRTFITALVLNWSIDMKSIVPELEEIARRYTWKVQHEDIGAFLDKKLAALFCYESQIRALMGGEKLTTKLLKKYHEFWNQAEPFWRAEKK